jgi:hypothetical protein
LGGIEGADNKCNILAKNAGLVSSERDVYKAIIFSEQENYNPAKVFSDCSGGYFLVDGNGNAETDKKVADSRDDLFDPDTKLQNTIDYFENGNKRNGTRNVWTGADEKDGKFVAGDDCGNDWSSAPSNKTGRRGRTTSTDSEWLDVGTSACNESRRIYCAEQK